MPRRRHASVPIGPAGSRPISLPSFAVDPVAWFDAVDALLLTEPAAVRALPAESWTDPNGHHWRVVTTADGPEVRPGLESPFLIHGRLPRITALLISPPTLAVELSMRDWRHVAVLRAGHCSVRDLGLAMLTGVELPHEGLDRIGRETWEIGSVRWTGLRAGGTPIAVPIDPNRTLA